MRHGQVTQSPTAPHHRHRGETCALLHPASIDLPLAACPRSAFRSLKNVVLVDGCRLPFQPSGTVYNKLVAYDLARLALTGLLTKTGVGPKSLDYVIMGTVIQEVKNQNIARDAGLAAGIPREVPSHTVTQACISSNQAICSGINLIQTGQADVVIAGGVETMSDVPIKFSKPIRERMLASRTPLMGSDWPPTATDDP